MKEFQTRRRWRGIFFSRPAAILLFLATAWIFGLTAREYLAVKVIKKENAALEKDLISLEEKNKTMEERLKNMGSASGLEKIIRERFNVKKLGENVLVVINEERKETGEESEKRGFFNSLWLAIKNIF